MPTLDSVTFDETTVESREDQNGVRYWFTAQGDGCGLYLFDCAPDIAANLDDIDALRQFFRQMTQNSNMGFIEAEKIEVDGCIAVKTIVKAPQKPSGMTYIGSVVLPFRDFSYVLKVQCEERGMTGIRDAVVLDRMLESGKVKLNDGKPFGWWQDAYEDKSVSSVMRNLSDSREYDAMFPEHPLSRVRNFFEQVLQTVRIADDVKSAAPFSYSVSKKSWWKKS